MEPVEDGCLVSRSLEALCFVVGSGVIKEFEFCSPSGPRHTANGVVGVIDKKSMSIVQDFILVS